MNGNILRRLMVFLSLLALAVVALPAPSMADSAASINYDVTAALNQLYATSPAAKKMGSVAKGILVFPSIVKGGFIMFLQQNVQGGLVGRRRSSRIVVGWDRVNLILAQGAVFQTGAPGSAGVTLGMIKGDQAFVRPNELKRMPTRIG